MARGIGRPPTASTRRGPTPPRRPTARRVLAGRPTSLVKPAAGSRRHTVAEGDTLYGLAEHYYGDGEQFIEIYQANRDVMKRPDRLEVGTVLIIPDLPAAP